MRISNNMGYSTFSYNIGQLQERDYRENIKKTTGKEIISIADAPGNLIDIKKINTAKLQRENYININNLAIVEMRSAEDQADNILESLQQIRDLSIGSTNASYDGNVSSVGIFIKGILTDILRNANSNFNGKYLFSGTKTNPNSLDISAPDLDNMPFELVTEAATPENPSGLKIIFKGNNENRIINKDSHSSENINLKASDLFGSDSIEAFQPIIDIYNILMYTKDGQQRVYLDSLDREDKAKISELQQEIAQHIESTSRNVGAFASKRVRLETITLQMTEEVTRLNEIKSLKEDADMTKVVTNLMKIENALQYTLQSVSKLSRRTLFDFLS